jgi:hypothetical protein
MLKLSLSSSIILIAVCFACSPKQTPALLKVNLSPTAQLVAGKRWVEANVFVIHNPDTVSRDITRQFPQQERDDVLILADDGTFKYDEGTTKFNALHKQVFTEGNWTVDENRKILFLSANGSTDEYEILELTDSTLVLKLNVMQRTRSYAYRLIFKREE